MHVDWDALRASALTVMPNAHAPYSQYKVGCAALVDDGRTVVGVNVENRSYGVTLCAECGMVGALHASGGGRLVAFTCVNVEREIITPCGRCRELLLENGGPELLIDTPEGVWRMADMLPLP